MLNKKSKKKDIEKEMEQELMTLNEMSDSAAELIIESEIDVESMEDDDEDAESREIIKAYQ